jgi:putative spermidine/putrescine transport system substrate-binding protein
MRMSRSVRRSRAIAAVGTVLSALLVGACGGAANGAADGSVTLTFATYGGPYEAAQKQAWIDGFQAANPGIKVLVTGPVDYGKIKAMTEAGNVGWDVVDVNGDYGMESQSKYLTPIDCARVTACATPLRGLTNTRWRIAENTSAFTLAYNTDKVSGTPKNWADFFDTAKFPGKRALPKSVGSGALEAALLADGVPADQLYPLDVDRALKKLDTIKKDIVWWETGTQSEQLVSSGEVVMGGIWSPRAYNLAVTSKKPVAIQWNQQMVFGSYLVVPKGGRHTAEAMKLIDWITSPKRNGAISAYYPVGPGTADAKAAADSPLVSWLPSSHLQGSVAQNDAWWDKNLDEVGDGFQTWLQS